MISRLLRCLLAAAPAPTTLQDLAMRSVSSFQHMARDEDGSVRDMALR